MMNSSVILTCVSPILLCTAMNNTLECSQYPLHSSISIGVTCFCTWSCQFQFLFLYRLLSDSVLRLNVSLLSCRILSYQLEDDLGCSTTIKYLQIIWYSSFFFCMVFSYFFYLKTFIMLVHCYPKCPSAYFLICCLHKFALKQNRQGHIKTDCFSHCRAARTCLLCLYCFIHSIY
jgi:hypothetical protein